MAGVEGELPDELALGASVALAERVDGLEVGGVEGTGDAKVFQLASAFRDERAFVSLQLRVVNDSKTVARTRLTLLRVRIVREAGFHPILSRSGGRQCGQCALVAFREHRHDVLVDGSGELCAG